MEELAALGTVVARSPVIDSAPMGAARRRFANAAAVLESDVAPPELLAHLKAMEHAFGRRGGQAWGDRVLDLDIVLWSGGIWESRQLQIPHDGFAKRAFVLTPACAVAPGWRDPKSGRTVKQLHTCLTRPHALLRDAAGRTLSSVGRARYF